MTATDRIKSKLRRRKESKRRNAVMIAKIAIWKGVIRGNPDGIQ